MESNKAKLPRAVKSAVRLVYKTKSKTMKKLIIEAMIALALLLPIAAGVSVITTGCQTASVQKQGANILYTLHKTADLALDDYLDLVVKGTVKTNSIPRVMSAYASFQLAYSGAVALVASSSNAVPPQAVLDSAAAFASIVSDAKKGTP